jgi:hypothetical protein
VDGGGVRADGATAGLPSFFLDSKSDVREIYPEDSISFFYLGFASVCTFSRCMIFTLPYIVRALSIGSPK